MEKRNTDLCSKKVESLSRHKWQVRMRKYCTVYYKIRTDLGRELFFNPALVYNVDEIGLVRAEKCSNWIPS